MAVYEGVFGQIIGMRDQLGRLLPRDFTTFIFSYTAFLICSVTKLSKVNYVATRLRHLETIR